MAGVGGGDQLDDLGLHVVEDILQIPQRPWLHPADEADVRGLDDRVEGHVEGGVPPVLLNEVVQHVSGMAGMGSRADAAGDQNYPRLLPRHRYATGPFLVAC